MDTQELEVLDLINEEDVPESEHYVPKEGKDPRNEKWLDTRRLRNMVSSWRQQDLDYTEGGHPIGSRGPIYKPFSRPDCIKDIRKKNGKVEWLGLGDAWSKPFIYGKSSRNYMREVQRWWAEAYDALHENDD